MTSDRPLPYNHGMDLLMYTKSGNEISHDTVQAVNHLMDMEQAMGRWEFVAQLVRLWEKREPALAASYRSRTQNARYRGDMARDTAANADGGMRKLADVPVNLMDLLRFFYPEEYCTKPFMLRFVTEFPQFRVPEQL